MKPMAIAVIAIYTGGAASGWYLASTQVCTAYTMTIANAIAGAAGGFTAGLLSSGGDLKAAAQGALTGGLFGAVGGTFAAGTAESYAGHAVVGCVSSAAGGGSCGSGATSALFGKFASNQIAGIGDNCIGGDIARGVATAVAGGVGSTLAGGKFSNGAETAAYGYLFNELSHGLSKEQAGYEVKKPSLTYGEAVDHWADGGGTDVRVPLSSLDLSSVRTSDFAGVGDQRVFNLSGNAGTRLTDQLVYGNVTLKLVAPGVVTAGYDRYNFDIKTLTTSNAMEVLPRNAATWIGGVANSVASTVRNPTSGTGSAFYIQLDGRARIR